MITRPEYTAINAFDPMEWLKIHKIYDCDLDFTNMFPESREEEIDNFITQCNLHEYYVEPSTMYYLAGPYNELVDSGGTCFPIDVNIQIADEASFNLWEKGIPVFTPHLNTRGFHEPRLSVFSSIERRIEDSLFVKSLVDNLYRFSGLILLPNWQYSSGTKREIMKSLEIGKPIFHYGQVMIEIWDPINFKGDLDVIREEMVRK